MLDPSKYPAALPHESIEQIFPEVFLVHGSARVGPGMRMNRNMIIVRHNGALTAISPVRLDAAAESEVDRLEKLTNVIRIGYYTASMTDIMSIAMARSFGARQDLITTQNRNRRGRWMRILSCRLSPPSFSCLKKRDFRKRRFCSKSMAAC